MKVFFAFFLVVVVAFAGYHLTFRRLSGRSSGFRVVLTGLEFLFLGLLLGPQFFNVLDEKTATDLAPLTALMLGWIGLLSGFQFEAAVLRRFPSAFFPAAMIESIVTAFLVFIGTLAVLPSAVGVSFRMALPAAVILAAAAAGTAQAGLAMLERDAPAAARSGNLRLLRYMAGVDGFIPMAMLALLYFFRQPVHAAGPWRIEILIAGILAVIILLYLLLMGQRRGLNELALVIIAMTVLTSGAASMLGFSPLVANFFIGLFLVNIISREKEKTFYLLVSIEKPVYLLLLIFMGAAWQLNAWSMLPAALFFLALHFGGKLFGGMAATRLLPALRPYPKAIGLGLLEQGGLSIAILFDFQQRFAAPVVGYVVGSVLIAVILNNLISPGLLSRVVPGAGT